MREYQAANRLKGVDLEVYLPCVPTEQPRPGHADTPLFPGYIFVRLVPAMLSPDQAEALVSSVHLVRFDGAVAPISDEVIAAVVNRAEELEQAGGLRRRFDVGEEISVLLGRTQTLGRVAESADALDGHIKVMVRLFGQLMPLDVPMPNVVGAGPVRPPRRTRGKGRWIQGFAQRAIAPGPVLAQTALPA